MTIEELKVQSDRMLNELNYNQHMISGNGNEIWYTFNSTESSSQFYPTIKVWIDKHGNANMSLQGVLPFGLFVEAKQIQFNHPRLRTYINKIYRFTQLCYEEDIQQKELGKI